MYFWNQTKHFFLFFVRFISAQKLMLYEYTMYFWIYDVLISIKQCSSGRGSILAYPKKVFFPNIFFSKKNLSFLYHRENMKISSSFMCFFLEHKYVLSYWITIIVLSLRSFILIVYYPLTTILWSLKFYPNSGRIFLKNLIYWKTYLVNYLIFRNFSDPLANKKSQLYWQPILGEFKVRRA